MALGIGAIKCRRLLVSESNPVLNTVALFGGEINVFLILWMSDSARLQNMAAK